MQKHIFVLKWLILLMRNTFVHSFSFHPPWGVAYWGQIQFDSWASTLTIKTVYFNKPPNCFHYQSMNFLD